MYPTIRIELYTKCSEILPMGLRIEWNEISTFSTRLEHPVTPYILSLSSMECRGNQMARLVLGGTDRGVVK